LKSLEKEDLEE